MLRFLVGALMLSVGTVTAAAQTANPSGTGQVTTPSGQNSGAGIPGKPGGKSGPPVRPPSATTGAGASSGEQHNDAVRQQDSSKIPGQPGNKSGPAAK
jgi:hypothetical protein